MNQRAFRQAMRRAMPGAARTELKELLKLESLIDKARAKNGAFFNEVAALLFRHDPERIAYGRESAYRAETGTILVRLPECQSREDVRRVVHQEFLRWFNGHVEPEGHYTKIATELWGLWQKQKRLKFSHPNP